MSDLKRFWRLPSQEVFQLLQTRPSGLNEEEASLRLKARSNTRLNSKKQVHPFLLLLAQFNSPLIYLLLAAVVLSLFFRSHTDAIIILTIIFGSGFLSFIQEKKAAGAVNALMKIVKTKTRVLREEKIDEIETVNIVPGDIVCLSAGDMIPGDCYVLEAKDFYVDEATLTGETLPREKKAGPVAADAHLVDRTNALFMGTHVVSGDATAVVICIGKETEFGQISEHLRFKPPETSFESGVRHFGYFLLEVTLLLVLLIFAFNVYFGRPFVDSLLFALALAVGLTPQLLPAIITINLSYGAKKMAEKKVIIKKLASIENFGGMDVLCVDKTGTLTSGIMTLSHSMDPQNRPSSKVALLGCINAFFQTGYTNPIDAALDKARTGEVEKWSKLDEIPFDFVRKRVSILSKQEKKHLMITKGAFAQVISACSKVEIREGECADLQTYLPQITQNFSDYVMQGLRVIALAYKDMAGGDRIGVEDEKDLIFTGFLLFSDPPKPEIEQTILELKHMGVALKMITGDHHLAAAYFAKQIGMPFHDIILGSDLQKMSDAALLHKVNSTTVFAEIEPNQKERIILALRKRGHIVGFLGDGINDVTALHASDVSISVNSAVDVAKETSDVILLDKDLAVLKTGVREGRRTFANTIKYVFMATSANFGNMFSMAGASLFLSFLPLLPKQILLTNFLTDFPEMAIATDRVDEDMLKRPLRWDLKMIRRFMIVFGLISSIFDYLTFFVLLRVFQASVDEFRTGWFVESVLSATAIVLVIRTTKSFFKSRASLYLLSTALLVMAVTALLPFTPLADLLGFVPIKMAYFAFIFGIIVVYVVSVEVAKRWFYASVKKMRSV